MIFGLTLRWLWRWYIIIPGILVAAALTAMTWFVVPPTYQRTATLLLVPGAGTVPDEGNPYFYLGGLTQAADVVVRAVGSENLRRDIKSRFPGVAVQVTRDPTTAGPVILIVVEAADDESAAAVQNELVQRTSEDLRDLQKADRVPSSDRIQVRSVAIDAQGTLRNRSRMVLAAGVGIFTLALLVAVSVLVEIVSSARSRGRSIRANEAAERSDRDTDHGTRTSEASLTDNEPDCEVGPGSGIDEGPDNGMTEGGAGKSARAEGGSGGRTRRPRRAMPVVDEDGDPRVDGRDDGVRRNDYAASTRSESLNP